MRRLAMGAAWLGLAALAGCATAPMPASSPSRDASLRAAFVVRTGGPAAVVRVVTSAAVCPSIRLDGGTDQAMAVRAAPAVIAPRSDAAPGERLPVVFDTLSCEAALPPNTKTAQVGSPPFARSLAVPAPTIARIAILGDTGCRLKGNDVQDCNDATAWPFARVAALAASKKPDLVVHLGDIHYRESPCPVGRAGCAGSPWGYGSDTWEADFFRPAAPLLAVAPWVFVRGNHESCARAGQGWFRFVDAEPWAEKRSCNDELNDDEADFSTPYAVPLDAQTQLIVFDSSRVGLQPYPPADATAQRYGRALEQAAALARQAPNSYFLNHHPVLGFAPRSKGSAVWPGNGALQAVMAEKHGARYFAPDIRMAWHGHVHLFEAIDFASQHPFTLVVGNSGSQNDAGLPRPLPARPAVAPGVDIRSIVSHADYGFTTLDRTDAGWALTAWRVDGQVLARCTLSGANGQCQAN